MQALSIYGPVREALAQVEENLKSVSNSPFSHLSDLLNYVLDVPGKRIRPAITLLSGKLRPHDEKLTVLMATALELLHIATLIHDDTVDDSDTRRGRATVSSRWGRKVAVLLGDYVFASSAIFVSNTEIPFVIRRFSETILALSSGELSEVIDAYNWRQSREHYWERIYNKTASLFSTAAECGAILSGAPEEEVQNLKEYGRNIGMAFQVADDILDFEGTAEEVGKPVGHDLLQGTLTLPGILLLERYPKDNPIPALFDKSGDDGHLQRAVEMIQNSTIIQDSYAIARGFCDEAMKLLRDLPEGAAKESLASLGDYVLERRS